MKADRMGTYTEQIRARFGWKPAKQRQSEGLPKEKTCRHCEHFWLKDHKNGWGAVDFKPYCGAKGAGEDGFATREGAGCDSWEQKQTT